MKVESVYIPTSIYNQKSSAKFLSEIKKTETSDAVVFDKERRENRRDDHLTDEEQHLHEDVDQHDVEAEARGFLQHLISRCNRGIAHPAKGLSLSSCPGLDPSLGPGLYPFPSRFLFVLS